MDFTTIHWLYKLAICCTVFLVVLSLDVVANTIKGILNNFSYRVSECTIIGFGLLTWLSYAAIICAVWRLIYKSLWG